MSHEDEAGCEASRVESNRIEAAAERAAKRGGEGEGMTYADNGRRRCRMNDRRAVEGVVTAMLLSLAKSRGWSWCECGCVEPCG